jgi:hypothetical protein
MRPRNKDFPPCPDCGGPVRSNGKRRGTNIRRYQCVGEGSDKTCRRRFTDNTKDEPKVREKTEVQTKPALSGDTHVYVFTWAQNATPVHEGFWVALNAYCNSRGADLNVIQGRYRNPTRRGEEADDEWWVDEVVPHLWNQRADICPALTVLADIPIQPTGKRPLTGLDSHTGGKSGIVGHPKIEMRCIPTPQNDLPKQMQTTGACTIQNYSRSKAGKQGEFHHAIGAVVVEVRGDVFHMRQINALCDGSFIDLNREYLPDGRIEEAAPALALSMGDWHSGFTDGGVIEATFGLTDSTGHDMCAVLRPKQLLWDDLLDQYSRNHHHIDNPFISIAKHKDKYYDRGNLADEVEAACNEVVFYTELASEQAGHKVKSVIKSSNHDEALTRYIKERNWKNDPENAEFYLETALEMARRTKMGESGAQYPDAFHVWAERLCPDATLLGRRGSYMIGDIECIYHGDVGPNGARGSIMNFSKIGCKTVIGHSHTPGIVDGCYQVGTSTRLDLEYARGPSSWSNTHCVIYANGKRALLTIIDGKWRHE